MKTIKKIKGILAMHGDELRERFKVKELGVFGSYVRGEGKETSDIDILVEFEEPVSLLGLVSLENHLSDLFGLKVDLVPKSEIRPELKEKIIKEVVLSMNRDISIYVKDITKVLEDLKGEG